MPIFFFSSKLCLNAFNYKVWTTSINCVYFILCVIGKFWEYIVRNSAWQVDCIRALYMYLMNVFPHVLSVWATLLQCVIVFDLFPNTCTSLFMFWLRKLAYFSLVYICLWFLFQELDRTLLFVYNLYFAVFSFSIVFRLNTKQFCLCVYVFF